MKPRRLHLLLAVVALLLGLRWWAPPMQEPAIEVAAAVARPTASARTAIPQVNMDGALDLSGGTREIDANESRDPFAVRQPNPPAAPAPLMSPMTVTVAPPLVGPPAPLPPPTTPPPAPPPFQVVGSWRDDAGISVFVAGPSGLQQVRAGDVIADYRFARVTSSQIQLKHLPSNRDVSLPVPVGVESFSLTMP